MIYNISQVFVYGTMVHTVNVLHANCAFAAQYTLSVLHVNCVLIQWYTLQM